MCKRFIPYAHAKNLYDIDVDFFVFEEFKFEVDALHIEEFVFQNYRTTFGIYCYSRNSAVVSVDIVIGIVIIVFFIFQLCRSVSVGNERISE